MISKIFNVIELFIRERILNENINPKLSNEIFIAMRYYHEIYNISFSEWSTNLLIEEKVFVMKKKCIIFDLAYDTIAVTGSQSRTNNIWIYKTSNILIDLDKTVIKKIINFSF